MAPIANRPQDAIRPTPGNGYVMLAFLICALLIDATWIWENGLPPLGRSIGLDPPLNAAGIHLEGPLGQHLSHVLMRQGISQVRPPGRTWC